MFFVFVEPFRPILALNIAKCADIEKLNVLAMGREEADGKKRGCNTVTLRRPDEKSKDNQGKKFNTVKMEKRLRWNDNTEKNKWTNIEN